MRRHTLLLAAALAQITLPARADASLEYAVKAAYLPKFIPFITWPETPGAATICVLGEDPFAGKLEQAAGGIRVRRVTAPDPACQVLFLSDPATAEDALEALRGKPVMTVTDSGLKAHGIISFVIEANHVRFDIDDALAGQSGLTISSKLLGLAHAVKPRVQP